MLLEDTPKNRQKVIAKNGLYRLLVYGSLKDGQHPEDSTDGQMRVADDGWAVCRFDLPGIVRGELHYVDKHALNDISKREEYAAPHYVQVIVRLHSGLYALSYQYSDEMFDHQTYKEMPLIKNGVWTWKFVELAPHPDR